MAVMGEYTVHRNLSGVHATPRDHMPNARFPPIGDGTVFTIFVVRIYVRRGDVKRE